MNETLSHVLTAFSSLDGSVAKGTGGIISLIIIASFAAALKLTLGKTAFKGKNRLTDTARAFVSVCLVNFIVVFAGRKIVPLSFWLTILVLFLLNCFLIYGASKIFKDFYIRNFAAAVKISFLTFVFFTLLFFLLGLLVKGFTA